MANKGGVILGIAGLGALSWLVKQLSKKAPEDEEDKGDISIVIYDSEGNVVPAHSPVTLNEGSSYSFAFTVRNTSTRGGIPIGVAYALTYQVLVSGAMLARNTIEKSFGAGQEISFGPIPFTVEWGLGGQSGAIDVIAEVPATGAIVASASQIINVVSVAINYGAVIVII